jgi:hypothetical protein
MMVSVSIRLISYWSRTTKSRHHLSSSQRSLPVDSDRAFLTSVAFECLLISAISRIKLVCCDVDVFCGKFNRYDIYEEGCDAQIAQIAQIAQLAQLARLHGHLSPAAGYFPGEAQESR